MAKATLLMEHRRSAFTLIEILVVISIIAILISILMPTLQSAREVARQAVCLSNLRQISLGINTYAIDNGGYYPSSRGYGAVPPTDAFAYSWEAMLQQDGYIPGRPTEATAVWHCPSDPLETIWTWGTRRSYGGNRGHWSHMYGWWGGFPYTSGICTARTETIKQPSDFFLLMEAAESASVPATIGRSIFGYNSSCMVDEDNQLSMHRPPTEVMPSYLAPSSGNFGFADGHAAWLDQQALIANRTPIAAWGGYMANARNWSRTGVIENLSTKW